MNKNVRNFINKSIVVLSHTSCFFSCLKLKLILIKIFLSGTQNWLGNFIRKKSLVFCEQDPKLNGLNSLFLKNLDDIQILVDLIRPFFYQPKVALVRLTARETTKNQLGEAGLLYSNARLEVIYHSLF